MHFPGPAIEELVVSPAATVLETMRVLDRGYEVALVCDGPTLVGVVTDGDVRRSLLAGGALSRPVGEIATPSYFSVGPDVTRVEAIRLMTERRFKCLPVVDAQRRLLDLHTLHSALLGQRLDSWAVVMAGGRGERLGELTDAIPKPMLPVGGRPILEHIVLHLVSHGIRRIFISVNYLGSMIEDHFGDGSRWFCRIDYLREEAPLGTGGALALLPERPTHPLVVMNGDLMTRINLGRMLAVHASGPHVATVALREYVLQVPFGVAEVEGVRLTGLLEKPTRRHHINAGIYVLSPSLLARVSAVSFVHMTDVLKGCLARGEPVAVYPMQEAWTDMGVPSAFAAPPPGFSPEGPRGA